MTSSSSSSSRRSSTKPDGLTAGEYATLVGLLAVGIILAAWLVTWSLERGGILAPGTTPRPPQTPSEAPDAESAPDAHN